MNDKYQYMSDEELLEFIEDVEYQGMLSSPTYLKDQIMNQVICENETIPLATPYEVRGKQNNHRQLLLYSMKVAIAAIAALYFLMIIPMDMTYSPAPYEDRMEERIRKDMEEYEAENEKLLEEEISIGTLIDNKSDEVFELLNKFTNKINNGGNKYD